MKKMILITILISQSFTSTVAQLNRQIKIDTTFRNLSVYGNPDPFNRGNSNNFMGSLNGSQYGKKSLVPKFSNKNPSFGLNSIGNIENAQFYDDMPCIKPQGFFPMRIYKPDSSMKYSLLIKKIKIPATSKRNKP